MDADGSNARNLTNDQGNDRGPDWSPNGRTIVFNSDRDGPPMGGFVVDADGSHLRRIDSDAWIGYPRGPPTARASRHGRDQRVRDKASLDIFWLRDESLENADNPPPPSLIAAEIVEDLEAALAEFALIAESLGGEAEAE